MQLALEVACTTDEKVPTGQEVQETEPGVADHDPAAQGTQTEEKDPVVFQEQSIFQLGGLNQIYCYPGPLALWMRVTDNV